jgi:hypothetical protein
MSHSSAPPSLYELPGELHWYTYILSGKAPGRDAESSSGPIWIPYKKFRGLHAETPQHKPTEHRYSGLFDVVSLFTKVPLKDSLQLLGQRFETSNIDLFQQAVTLT